MAFKFRTRTAEQVETRANMQAGEFESFISDAYRTFSAKKGENHIRILPGTWEDTAHWGEHYGIDVYVHYSVGPENASVLCPYAMRKQACPICEEKLRMERRGDNEAAKELRAARRILMWVINGSEADKGALAWSAPFTLDREFNKQSRDRTTGEYYLYEDPDSGYDIYFTREGERLNTKYNGVQLARRPTSVEKTILDYIIENPLPNILRWHSYDEIKALFEGVKAPEEVASRPRVTVAGDDREPDRREPPPRDRDDDRREPQREPEREREPLRVVEGDAAPQREPEQRPGGRVPLQPLDETSRAALPDDKGPPPRAEMLPPPPPPPSSGGSRAEALRARLGGGR